MASTSSCQHFAFEFAYVAIFQNVQLEGTPTPPTKVTLKYVQQCRQEQPDRHRHTDRLP